MQRQAETVTAEAREQELALAGAISDHEQKLLEIAEEKAIDIAKGLEKIQTPDVMFIDASVIDPEKGSILEQVLPSLGLLREMNILTNLGTPDVQAKPINAPPLPADEDPTKVEAKEEVKKEGENKK